MYWFRAISLQWRSGVSLIRLRCLNFIGSVSAICSRKQLQFIDSYTARIDVMRKYLSQTGPTQKLIHSNTVSVAWVLKRRLLEPVHPQSSAIEFLQ